MRGVRNARASVVVALGLLGGLAACQTTNPQTASVIAQPKSAPVKTVTSFTPALRCMDELFVKYNKKDIVITSAGIPDHTGAIKAGTKDMMISAISRMSIRSNAFRFVDFDKTQTDVYDLQNDVLGFTEDFLIPNYYIRGAITQLDAGVAQDSVGGGISLPSFAIGYNQDQILSVMSVDLNIGNLVTRQIMPGIQATNSIAVARSGKGGDTDAQIGSVGLFFQLSFDRSEGTHAALRTLIELSLIEALGKFTKTPYWRCLEVDATNPAMIAAAREWFDGFDRDELVRTVRAGLVAGGYLSGPSEGDFDDAMRRAISRYQAENELIANGRITFDLYYDMLGHDLLVGADTIPKDENAIAKAREAATRARTLPLSLDVRSSPSNRLGVGQAFSVSVKPSEAAFVYCYYRDGANEIVRVFPNRFVANSYVSSDSSLRIPAEGWPFSLVASRSGASESVVCVASRRELGIGLPAWLSVDDFEPIRTAGLTNIVDVYRKLDARGMAVGKVEIPVR